MQQAIKEKKELETKLITANDETQKLQDEKLKVELEKRVTESVLRTTEATVEKLKNDLQKEKEESKKELDKSGKLLVDAQASGDSDEIKRLQELFNEKDSAHSKSLLKIEELERQIKEEPIEVTAAPVVEKIPEEIEKELQLLRKKAQQSESVSDFTVNFKSLVQGFENLLGSLAEIKGTDTEEHEKYVHAVKGLVGKMLDRL